MSRFGALLLSATAPHAIRRLRRSTRHPADVQRSRLLGIVTANADTEFGRRHGFERVASFADFQSRVPISTYDDLQPYIAAAMAGRPYQLTREPPVLFTMTSGTTGARKYIPMTASERAARRGRSRLWVSAFFHDHPHVTRGRVLSMVSPEIESHAPNGIPCGSESGHFYRTMPPAVRSLYSTPYDVFTLADYEAKYYTLLRIAAGHDIRCIVTPNPSTIVLLAERLGAHTESIIRDVYDGGLCRDIAVPAAIRASLHLPPDPNRARQLEQAAAASDSGSLRPSLVWPHLAALGCWKAGSVAPYLSRFDRYFTPGTPVRDLGYLATETAGSVPLTDDGVGGVAAVGTDVFEFYPAHLEQPPAGPDLLTVDQLDIGGIYKIVVTTAAGLYRYDMNDIVDVVGRFDQTPIIRFVQKGDGVVSLTGEKLAEIQVVGAVEDAFHPELDAGAFVAALAELVDGLPRLAVYVEVDALSDSAGRAVIARLDRALGRRNVEYSTKRDSGRYGPPILRLVPIGELDRYRHRMVDAGRADGQFKIRRLTTDATFTAQFAVAREIKLRDRLPAMAQPGGADTGTRWATVGHGVPVADLAVSTTPVVRNVER
jgi:GH3 auxin-responsive promoter